MSDKSFHDPSAYVLCMEEIKRRVEVLDHALGPFQGDGSVNVPNCELALLQLRKCYELVAFASLAANRGEFLKVWKRFSREWRLDKIVRSIERSNPDFLPVPIRENPSEDSEVRSHIVPLDKPRLTSQQLIKLHGKVGVLMHARNPFGTDIDYEEHLGFAAARRDELVAILNLHMTTIVRGRVYYRVAMGDRDGDVQCATLEAHVAV